MLNRHGLVAGATGTGKTKTLQLMAGQLSRAGVPVFIADVKGDLTGMALPGRRRPMPGSRSGRRRSASPSSPTPTPWTCSRSRASSGAPVRATVSSFGPLLLARILDLNTDPDERPLARLQVLRRPRPAAPGPRRPAHDAALPGHRRGQGRAGGIRRCLGLHAGSHPACPDDARAGGHRPLLRRACLRGRGPAARRRRRARASCTSSRSPTSWTARGSSRPSCSGCWRSSTRPSPRSATCPSPSSSSSSTRRTCSSADAPKALLEQVELTVRLIRSKGVGVYFVTHSPTDVPSSGPGAAGQPRPARPARLHAGGCRRPRPRRCGRSP